MKLIKKYKGYILSFILGAILFSSITAYAAILISSEEVGLSSTKTTKTNVKESLDELYTLVDTKIANGYAYVTYLGSSYSKPHDVYTVATFNDVTNIAGIKVANYYSDTWSWGNHTISGVSGTDSEGYYIPTGEKITIKHTAASRTESQSDQMYYVYLKLRLS